MHPLRFIPSGFFGRAADGVTDYAYITVQADHSRQGSFKETVAGGMYGLKLGDDPDNPNIQSMPALS